MVTSNGAKEKGAASTVVHLTRRRECRGKLSLADTSFLQLSRCRALVLDGTKGFQDELRRTKYPKWAPVIEAMVPK